MKSVDFNRLKTLYKGKFFGLRLYKSEKQVFTVEDFANITTLEDILIEVRSGKISINLAAQSFIDKYYGVDNLAKIMSKRSKFMASSGIDSVGELSSWLQELVKSY